MWHDEVQRKYSDTDKIFKYFHIFVWSFFVLVFVHDRAGITDKMFYRCSCVCMT